MVGVAVVVAVGVGVVVGVVMTELRGNGALSVILTPNGDLERAWHAEMASLASKGSTVTLSLDDKGRLVVSVERR